MKNIPRCSTCKNFLRYYKKIPHKGFVKANRGQCAIHNKECLPTCPSCEKYLENG